jgi:hypothetical protein
MAMEAVIFFSLIVYMFNRHSAALLALNKSCSTKPVVNSNTVACVAVEDIAMSSSVAEFPTSCKASDTITMRRRRSENTHLNRDWSEEEMNSRSADGNFVKSGIVVFKFLQLIACLTNSFG